MDKLELRKKQAAGLSLRLNDDKFKNLRQRVKSYAEENFSGELADIFYRCFFNTIDTTCHFESDGSVFLLTGDIPAMWLRDSVPQVMQYLFFASEDEEVRAFIKGVLKRLFSYIVQDAYANAFKRTENDYGEWDTTDKTDKPLKIVWERKYELDSLCYPLFLAAKYYEFTLDDSCFDGLFVKAFDEIIKTVEKERKHSERSSYFFLRALRRTQDVGYSDPNGEKGLVWSGFRPSDDECKFHYHIPDNMFLVSVLHKLAPIFKNALKDDGRAAVCENLCKELSALIEKYGTVKDEYGNKIYLSETDCMGGYHYYDDANIPSLLSIPYLEYPFIDKEIYANTRKTVLSKKNKYYYEGKILKGIGSPHTPEGRVWPLALSMQALTSDDAEEINGIVDMLIASTDNTGYMHEGVDCNDVSEYSRPWFAWANSLFAYLLLSKKDYLKR